MYVPSYVPCIPVVSEVAKAPGEYKRWIDNALAKFLVLQAFIGYGCSSIKNKLKGRTKSLYIIFLMTDNLTMIY